jgi:hypothetical protein
MQSEFVMKIATLPSLRVEPALREAAEAVLQENETLSSLMETAVRDLVRRREVRAEFLRRGIESLEEYRRNGVSIPADKVHDELQQMLDARRKEMLG